MNSTNEISKAFKAVNTISKTTKPIIDLQKKIAFINELVKGIAAFNNISLTVEQYQAATNEIIERGFEMWESDIDSEIPPEKLISDKKKFRKLLRKLKDDPKTKYYKLLESVVFAYCDRIDELADYKRLDVTPTAKPQQENDYQPRQIEKRRMCELIHASGVLQRKVDEDAKSYTKRVCKKFNWYWSDQVRQRLDPNRLTLTENSKADTDMYYALKNKVIPSMPKEYHKTLFTHLEKSYKKTVSKPMYG